MLLTVEEFQQRVASNLPGLVEELAGITGRGGPEEREAWSASLPCLARALSSERFSALHLFFTGGSNVALEYKLPAASAWCDVVLLGKGPAAPTALFIELKHWETWGDRPGPVEGLVYHRGILSLHPSDQVRGYAEYCRRFHSAIREHAAEVRGCVLFTHAEVPEAYVHPPNDRLVRAYPCFAATADGVQEAFPKYVARQFHGSDEDFATQFVEGAYSQDRGFVRQIGEQILDPDAAPFELLDHQRRAFHLVRARVADALFGEKDSAHSAESPRKHVILIQGPPGSGKSVLAAKLWATLATDNRLPNGDVVLTTTSTAQTSNWMRLFERAARSKAGRGIVKKAASYVPLSTQQVGRLRKRFGNGFIGDPTNWRGNLRALEDAGIPFQEGARNDQYLVSIVDEAHALINPEHPEGRGQFGFPPTLGPLAWHIIRCSRVSVFFLDQAQGFRDRENTSIEDIESWARELGAAPADRISLEDAQFRCGGSVEFVEWIDALFADAPPDQLRKKAEVWRRALDFQIFDTPAALERALRTRVAEGRSSRSLSEKNLGRGHWSR